MSEAAVGLTKDGGWQAGVRRTLPVRPELAWEFLVRPDVLRLWLGEVPARKMEQDTEFLLPDGTRRRMTVFQSGSHLRMQWQPLHYDRPAVLQMCIIPAGGKATFAFHQENLPDEAARSQRLVFFRQALDPMKRWL